jgi:hypothetical protein
MRSVTPRAIFIVVVTAFPVYNIKGRIDGLRPANRAEPFDSQVKITHRDQGFAGGTPYAKTPLSGARKLSFYKKK